MPTIIDYVLFPGALGLDITGPLEVFHTTGKVLRRQGNPDGGYRARFVAASKGPVRLSSGLEVVVEAGFGTRSPADALLIPGGMPAAQAAEASKLIDFIHIQARRVRRVISVCNGAFLLAAAGLLDGRRATTHWSSTEALASRYPKVKVRPDAIYTRDGHIYTSAGVTAGIDLALAVVEEDHGPSVALEVSRLLVIYYRRPGNQSQFSAPLKAQTFAKGPFTDLHNWLTAHLHRPITVDQMAQKAAMSPRNFARVFKRKTQMTPGKYLETLRLDRVRELLTAGDWSLAHIAEMSGFGREERLRRAFVRRFKVTPSQYRLHFLQA